MDIDYRHPEDFAADDSFVNYCFRSNQEDQAFWERWLLEHPGEQEAVKEARDLVFMMSVTIPEEEKKKQWAKVNTSQNSDAYSHTKRHFPHGRRQGLRWAAGVALLMIIIGGAYWFAETKGSRNHQLAAVPALQYTTASGQRNDLVLSDGTHVWLNADSKLTCDSSFTDGATREVRLSGEAYFEVSPDPKRPFIIHANHMNIAVLGTSFNVKAYPDDKTTETTLISGSIEITLTDDPSRKIRLKPLEKMTVFNEGSRLAPLAIRKTLTIHKDTMAEFAVSRVRKDPLLDSGTTSTAWMEGKLVFHNERFDDLARQMEHKYGIVFHFMDEDLKTYRFTGIFSTETVGEALHALQLTSPSAPFNYQIAGQQVTITNAK